jgi:hypothetical protein
MLFAGHFLLEELLVRLVLAMKAVLIMAQVALMKL